VRKAIATGRVTTLPDGTIDPARADSEWAAQTDPAKQRGHHARQMGAETAAGTARAAATKPAPQAAIRAVGDNLAQPRAALMAAEVALGVEKQTGTPVTIEAAILQRVFEANVRQHLEALADLRVSRG